MSRSSEEIDVGLLRVVRELSRQGTVTAAAAASGKSQSTLSRVQTLAPSFDPKQTRYRFRVHMIDLAELLILPGLLRRLADSASGVEIEIEVVRLAGQDVWSELEMGRLDRVIGTPWKAQPTLLRQQILEEQFVGVARKGHPLRQQLETLEGYLRCAIARSCPAQWRWAASKLLLRRFRLRGVCCCACRTTCRSLRWSRHRTWLQRCHQRWSSCIRWATSCSCSRCP
jgi:DNA-binding transcriptional LysR family regulator